MTRPSQRHARAALALAAAFGAFAPAARAQEAPPPGGEVAEGRPLDGYFATGALAGGILFILCKTARRN